MKRSVIVAIVVCCWTLAGVSAAPAAVPSISGVVKAADTDLPLAGHFVHVYDAFNGQDMGHARTGADGTYAIPNGIDSTAPLPAGPDLIVVARPPEADRTYLDQSYNGRPLGQPADILRLGPSEARTGIDFSLNRAPDNRLSGAARDAAGNPISTFNGRQLYIVIRSPSLDYDRNIPAPAGGVYEFTRLPPANDYHVSVETTQADGCVVYYSYRLAAGQTIGVDAPAASALFAPTRIPVAETTDLSLIDIIIDPSQPRTIEGTVTAADTGLPLQGYAMSIWTEDMPFETYPSTDATGHYLACGAPASDRFIVMVQPPPGVSEYFGAFYNGKENPPAADRVSTTAGNAAGIDFQLEKAPPNSVQGQARNTTGMPLPGVHVHCYSASLKAGGSAVTGPDGFFTIGGLMPAPDYRVSAYERVNGRFYDFYHYDTTQSVIYADLARTLDIAETSALFDIDIIVGVQGETISGAVYNTSDGAPIAGARAQAWSEGLQVGGDALTNAEGQYAIWGLAQAATAMDYYVVTAWSDTHVRQFYDNAASPEYATAVPTGATGIDFTLSTGLGISGNVTNAAGAPLRGAEVMAWSPTTLAHEIAITDDLGRYKIGNLKPQSSYQVSAFLPGFQRQWHKGRTREELADPVLLTTADRVIDFALERGAVIRGNVFIVTDAQPAKAGIRVEAWSRSALAGAFGFTDENGAYEITGLDAAITDYIILILHPGYLPVIYAEGSEGNVAYPWENGTLVSPSDTQPRNMTLRTGIDISGKVTLNGAPVKGIRVTARASILGTGTEEWVPYGKGEAFTKETLTDGVNYVIRSVAGAPKIPLIGGYVPVKYALTLHLPHTYSAYAGQSIEIEVSDQDITGIDFELTRLAGRTISGAVSGLEQGAIVWINAHSEARRAGASQRLLGTGETLTYALTSLVPANDYVVEMTSDRLPTVYYNNVIGWGAPDFVDATDADRDGIDFIVPDVAGLREIRGAVTFPAEAVVGSRARVEAFSPSTGVSRNTEVRLTNDSGTIVAYTLQGLPAADDYRVMAMTLGYRPAFYDGAASPLNAAAVDLSTESAMDIDLTLAVGAVISGTVTLDNVAMASVPVHAYSESTGAGGLGMTGASGAYAIKGLAAAGDYIVGIHPAGAGLGGYFYTAGGAIRNPDNADPVSTMDGDRTDIDLAIASGASISGAVTDQSGLSIEGVWMSAWSEAGQSGNGAFTQADGAYVIKALAENLRYTVRAEPHWSSAYLSASRTDVSAGAADVDFTLPEKAGAHAVYGTVTAGTVDTGGGAPVDGARVALWLQSAGALMGWDRTRGDGAFRIEGLVAGAYAVVVRPPAGSDRAFVSIKGVSIAGDKDLGEIALPAGGKISGAVTDSSGAALSAVRVIAASDSLLYWEEALANSRGEYVIANVPAAGDMVLTAIKSGYARETRAMSVGLAQAVTADFTLSSGGAISGAVRGVSGNALSEVLVTVTAPGYVGSLNYSGGAWTDQSGRYSVSDLKSADATGAAITDYQVTVDAFTRHDSEGSPIRYKQSVKTGKQVGDTVDFTLSQASDSAGDVISGTVGNPEALGGDYVAVDLFRNEGAEAVFEQHLLLDDAGGFRFSDLEAGQTYYLGFGVYTGETETYARFQWAGACATCGYDIGVRDAAGHQPSAGAKTYAPGSTGIDFRFDETLLPERSIAENAKGPGPVGGLRAVTHDAEPVIRMDGVTPRSAVQDLTRTPSDKVSNSPNVTVAWEPTATDAAEKYYFVFNGASDHQINKRNAPAPSSQARVATSQDLSGDYATWYFHVAAEDERGRIGETSAISFAIDTVAPRNVQARAEQTETSGATGIVQLELGATGATQMYLSNTGFGEGGQWENFSTARQWTLSDLSDTATVYIQFRDEAENLVGAVVTVSLSSILSLSDAISALEVLCGIDAAAVDATGDNVVDLKDAMYILQKVAGLRE